MKSFILRDVLAPVATRIGTALSGYMIGYLQAEPSLAHEAGALVAAGLLIAVDFISSAIIRRKSGGAK